MTPGALPGDRTLLDALDLVNRGRRAGSAAEASLVEAALSLLGRPRQGSHEALDEALGRPSRRLAVYGSLAPGEANADQLASLAGVWRRGVVTGVLEPEGWGAELGFPRLRLDPTGEPVAVDLFTSPALPGHWRRLDELEGADYVRLLVPVTLEDEEIVVANLYGR